VCKRERMQLQEDKCRPGRMQLKAEESAVLGVHPPFFHPLSEPCGSASDLCIPSRNTETRKP
jgi:hypothetical protein